MNRTVHYAACKCHTLTLGHRRTLDQKSHGHCNSNSVDWLSFYSLGTCLAWLQQQSLQSMHPCTVRYTWAVLSIKLTMIIIVTSTLVTRTQKWARTLQNYYKNIIQEQAISDTRIEAIYTVCCALCTPYFEVVHAFTWWSHLCLRHPVVVYFL